MGIPTGPASVLTVPGRKTGRPRSTPMTPFDRRRPALHRGRLPGRGLGRQRQGRGLGHIVRGRRSRPVRIVELGPEAARPVLRAFAEKVPVGVGFAKRAGLVVDGSPDEFEELAGRLAVFRFDPVG